MKLVRRETQAGNLATAAPPPPDARTAQVDLPLVPTRYLLILSAIAAVAILFAGAIWLLVLLT